MKQNVGLKGMKMTF